MHGHADVPFIQRQTFDAVLVTLQQDTSEPPCTGRWQLWSRVCVCVAPTLIPSSAPAEASAGAVRTGH